MKLKWLAHATFLITSENGTKILTDPIDNIDPRDNVELFSFDPLDQEADIVTVSHDHWDHCNIKAVKGNPVVVRESMEVKGISFKAIPSFHDKSEGAEHGPNTMMAFQVDGISLFVLGDLGHTLTDEQIAAVGAVDIIILPVGGFFTIGPEEADIICDQVKPKVIIPMHWKTEKCGLPIGHVDVFLEGKNNVQRPESSELEFKAGALPEDQPIIVLKPAML